MPAVGPCLALASWGKPPSEITPISMPTGAYQRMSCRQLANERKVVSADLQGKDKQQRNAVAGDAFGVFMIGVPMSSLTGGDKKADIAVDKGKLISINYTIQAKHCAALPTQTAADGRLVAGQ
ncbi:hypothetical protein COL154_014101 [Colletotrichum chrysophilum]|nr:hypothetical protein COL154_014101 [Colletotrichum chrysophilum]